MFVVAVASVLVLPASAGAWGKPRSGGLGHQNMKGSSRADYLRGAEGPDTIHGNRGADLLTGDTGPDRVSGGSGSDTISGGSGTDVLRGGPGNDIISGGFGKDGITGGSGSDAIDGGNDADKISGGPGNDVLRGGSGVDRISGGDGDDRIFADTGADEIFGGAGDDTIVVDGSAFAHVECGTGRDTLYVVVGAEETIDYAGRGFVAKYSSDCESVILTDTFYDPHKGVTYLARDNGGERTGTKRDDILLGGPGADTLHGGPGNDVLWGLRQPNVVSFARDVLDAGPGDDTVYGGPGPQRISGGDGDDFLESGIGDGKITGGRGADKIRLRGAGLTTVSAGAGNDTVYARGPARGKIKCGSGRDVVHADSGDSVARDCERVIGKTAKRNQKKKKKAKKKKAGKRATTRAATPNYPQTVSAEPGLKHWWRLGYPYSGASGFGQFYDAVTGATSTAYGGTFGVPGVTDDNDSAWEAINVSSPGHLSLGASNAILHAGFTFEAWLRPDDYAGIPRTILTDSTLGSVGAVVLVREADGSLRATIAAPSGGPSVTVRTPALDLTPYSWHHVALTRADDRLAIHVDGRVAAEAAATLIDVGDSTYGIGVGMAVGDYRDWFGGIDEVALYDRPLSFATITAHASAGDDGTPPVARFDPPLPESVTSGNVAAVVRVVADRAGASFVCSLDAGAYVPCRRDVSLYKLPQGDHVLRILATSRTGVRQQTPTVLRVHTDAPAPATLLVVRVSRDGDSRAIASFASDQPARFECRAIKVAQFAFGPWSPCSPPLVVPRDVILQVRAVNADGTVDFDPAQIIVPRAGRSFTTTLALPRFAAASAEAQIAGEYAFVGGSPLQCRVDGRSWAACSNVLQLPILQIGAHSLQVRQAIGGTVMTTPTMAWNVGQQPGVTAIAGLQLPLLLERNASLRRRARSVRFALSAPAAVEVSVLRRGKTRIRVRAAGRAGANVVPISGRRLSKLGTGRFTLRVVARAGSGRPTVQQLPLAIVPPLR